jgi:hypothetical protein
MFPLKKNTSAIDEKKPLPSSSDHRDAKDFYVIINGSGKCGTTSLYHSFIAIDLKSQHCHELFENPQSGPGFAQGLCVFDAVMKLSRELSFIHYSPETISLQQAKKKEKLEKYFLFIDVFRNPFERKIASFFENLPRNLDISFPLSTQTSRDSETKKRLYREPKNDPEVQQYILNIFNEKGLQYFIDHFESNAIQLESYQSSEKWAASFQVDIYKTVTFDHLKKYAFVENKEKMFLLLRFSDLDKWEQIIHSFDFEPKMKKFKLLHRNDSNKKWYSKIYSEFKEKYSPSKEICYKIFQQSDKLLTYFLSKQELHDYKKKWSVKKI